jgi:hypothetical protein
MKTSNPQEEANIQQLASNSTQENVSKSKSEVKAKDSPTAAKSKRPNYLRRLL